MKLRLWSLSLLLIAPVAWGETTNTALEELQKQLISENPEIKAKKAQSDAARLQSQSLRGSFLPELSLQAGYAEEKTVHENDHGYVGFLSGHWNLFRGGRDSHAWSLANNQQKITHLELEITRRRLQRELGEAYFAALLNSRFISLDTEKLQLLKNQRSMAQRKINAGLTSQVDALELDLEETTLSAEIETHKTDLQNSLEVLRALLNESEPPKIPEAEDFPRVTLTDFSVGDPEQSPLYLKQQLLNESSRLEHRQQLSDYLPTVDLEVQYGRLIPQYEDPGQGTESKASLLLTWNFFSGLSTHYQAQAKAAESASRLQETQQVRLQLQSQLINLQNKAKELLHLLNLLEKRKAVTQRYYDLTLTEYRRGVKNSSDLASATSSLFDNKTRLLEVQKELAILKLKFDEIND